MRGTGWCTDILGLDSMNAGLVQFVVDARVDARRSEMQELL